MSEKEIKREYLLQYGKRRQKIARIKSEIAEIREMRCSISVKLDGMPRGKGGHSDLSGYAAKLDQFERELMTEYYRRIKVYTNIKNCIEALSDETEREVLFYRYIKGMDWADIAEELTYSERQIMRYHGKALENLKLPENERVSECQ